MYTIWWHVCRKSNIIICISFWVVREMSYENCPRIFMVSVSTRNKLAHSKPNKGFCVEWLDDLMPLAIRWIKNFLSGAFLLHKPCFPCSWLFAKIIKRGHQDPILNMNSPPGDTKTSFFFKNSGCPPLLHALRLWGYIYAMRVRDSMD